MIELIIKGGLGNQMFQYAAAYSLAKKLDTELSVDLTFIETRLPIPNFTFRNYEIAEFFKLPIKTTRFMNIPFKEYLGYPLMVFYYKFSGHNLYVESDPYYFNPEFFNQPDGTVIFNAYFNNYKYFQDYDNDIRDMFNPQKLYDSNFDEIENKIANSNSVSINIRRGDYTNPKHKDVFVQLDLDYYKKAISIIRGKVENPHFFVFSYDDPLWLSENLALSEQEHTVMGKEYVGDRFKTYLRLISLCKHNIISNSTFAFWAAYLNKNPKKTVISPAKWMTQASEFEVPRGWISL